MNIRPFQNVSSKIKDMIGGQAYETVYLVCLSLLIILFNATCSTFDTASLPWLPGILSKSRYLLLAVMFISIIMIEGSYSVKELIIIASAGFLILLSARNCGDKNILFSLIVIVSSRNISVKKAARVYFFTYLAIIVLIIGLFAAGALDDFTMERGADLVRHSLGFNHPNLLGRFIMVEIIAFMLAYPEKNNSLIFYAASFLLAIFVYIVPNSRAAALCIIALIFFSLAMNRMGSGKALYRIAAYCSVPLFSLVSIVSTIVYTQESNVFFLIDEFSSGRIHAAHEIYLRSGWGGLFGKNVYGLNIPLDNIYAKLFLAYGIAATVIFLCMYILAIHRGVKCSRTDIVVCLMVFALYGVFEIHMVYVLYNLPLICICADIVLRDSENSKAASYGQDLHRKVSP